MTLFGIVTEARLLQPSKTLSPIDVTLFGMLIDVNPLQFWKAPFFIDVTLLGMLTDARLLHLSKVLRPIKGTLLGMVTEVNPLQPLKA